VRHGEVLAGKYRVDRILGKGGMGIVVAAHHLQLDQIVALKFLRPEAVANPEALDRFMREARNAVRLKSEHVARIIDVGTLDSGAPYIVMEYLEGSDLGGVLAQERTLPVPVAVDFILQACDAIAEAHALGIIHRDLKPQNLFVTRRHDNTPLVKVLDFGISKSMAGDDFAATLSQTVMGSPAYMSPEQMRSAKFVDGRTDVWALGIILYQLVVGHAPWKGEAFVELCFKIATDPLPPFPSAQPAGFEEVVQRCLEKDPNRRFSDVYALAVALSPFAPAHAQPLVESIGRVLQGQAGKRDARATTAGRELRGQAEERDTTPTAVGRVLRRQAEERDAMSTIAIGTSTLRQAIGQSMERIATGSRQRKIAGLVAAVGLLVGIVVTAVAFGGGRGDEPDRKPTSPPPPDRAAAPPAPSPALPPAGVAPSPPPAKPEPLTTQEARPAAPPPPKFEPPPPPPVAKPEPTIAHETPRAPPPPPKLEPPPVSSTAAKLRDKEPPRPPVIATPSKSRNIAPHLPKTPPAPPPPPKTTIARDPLSRPD